MEVMAANSLMGLEAQARRDSQKGCVNIKGGMIRRDGKLDNVATHFRSDWVFIHYFNKFRNTGIACCKMSFS